MTETIDTGDANEIRYSAIMNGLEVEASLLPYRFRITITELTTDSAPDPDAEARQALMAAAYDKQRSGEVDRKGRDQLINAAWKAYPSTRHFPEAVDVCCWEGRDPDWHTYNTVEAMRERVLYELRNRPDPVETCGEDDPDCIARVEAVNTLCRRALSESAHG